MTSTEADAVVRGQYEGFPYPPRDPEEERRRLLATEDDALARVNHYCFGGREGFQGFRALVAGGGTGDAAIYLAEQLRGRGQVTYIDLSAASRAIAEARAAVRGLANITFLTGSLIDLPRLGLGPFDYVNCSGVIHHLDDPEAGLAALAAVLRPGGALALMVYADWGRVTVYPMQELLRLIGGDLPLAERVPLARATLAALPASNFFHAHRDRFTELAETRGRAMGDAGLVDLLLHARDRAFGIDALEAMLERQGLALAAFTSPVYRQHYRPETFLAEPAIAALPAPVRRRIGELISGHVIKHSLLATKGPPQPARPEDPAMVPFWFPAAQARLRDIVLARLAQDRLSPVRLEIALDMPVSIAFQPAATTAAVFRQLDGRQSLAEMIMAALAAEPGLDGSAFVADYLRLFALFSDYDILLLRHRLAAPVADLAGSAP